MPPYQYVAHIIGQSGLPQYFLSYVAPGLFSMVVYVASGRTPRGLCGESETVALAACLEIYEGMSYGRPAKGEP